MDRPTINDPTPPAGGNDEFEPLPLPDEIPLDGVDPETLMTPEEAEADKNSKAAKKAGTHSTINDPDYAPKPTGEAQPEALLDNLAEAGSDLASGAKNVTGGAIKGAKETAKFGLSVASGRMFMPDDMRESAGGKKIQEQGKATETAIDSIPAPTAPESVAGKIGESIGQFTVGMIGAGKVMQAMNLLQKAGKGVTAARLTVQGGAAEAIAFDPTEERLSNLIEAYPSLANPITEYLAADPNDSEAEGRLKAFLEGATLGAAVDGLILVVKGVKRIREARQKGGEEEARKAAAEVADELEEAQAKAQAKAEAPEAGAPKAPPTPESLAQEDADSIIKELTDQADFPVDRITGLLNHEKIEGPGTMRQVLELTAEKLAPQIEKKVGGIQTWKETVDIADALGTTPEELWTNLAVLSKDANRQAGMVFAARRQMQGLAQAVWKEARALDNGVTTDRSRINTMVQKLAEMENILLPIRTAQARGTRQWGLSADADISTAQIKAIIASGGDVTATAKILRPPSAVLKSFNAYTEYWINSILSGPKTHLVNLTSNMIQSGLRPLEKMVGGNLSEGFDTYVGQVKAIKDSLALACKAFRTEESILDPRSLKTEGPRKAISAKAFGWNENSFMGAVANWTGTVVRIPTRMLLTADEFFKQMNYRANVYSMATREGMQKGMKGDTLATYIEARVAGAFDKTGTGVDEGALHEARISTFTEDLHPNSFANTLSTTVQAKHPWARLILPFIRTPTNIIKEVGWHTPGLNLAMKTYRAELAAGGQRAAAARGMWATGGALWTSAIALTLEGKLTGRGPADPNEKAALQATGWRPYSIKVGDTYVDYSRMDPYGMMFGLAADFSEAHGYMDEQSRTDIALAMGAAVARNLTSKTYFRGLAEFIEAVDQSHRDGPARFQHWAQSRAGSHVPSAFKQVAGVVGAGDDTMREVRGLMDAIYARTPGLSEKLPPKRNIFGEPIKYPAGFGPDSVAPIAYSTDLHDNVKDELARLEHAFTKPSHKMGTKGGIDLTKYLNEKGQDAYDRLMELHSIERKGRYTMKERLAHEIQSERYKNLPEGTNEYDSAKVKRVQAIRGEYLEACMRRLRKEYPNLDADIRTDARNVKAIQRQGPDALQDLLGN